MTTQQLTMPLLHGRALSYRRGDTQILSDVDIEAKPGERIAIVGPSGSGKTTLLAILAGLLKPTSGQVLFDGQTLPKDEPATRHGLAVILQGFGLVSLLTAEENIAIALRCTGKNPKEATTTAQAELAALGLATLTNNLTDELSGGQQQRVAVARALALKPKILLADEPTAQQDPDNRELVMTRILATADHGTAVLVATHDQDFAARCDREVHLRSNTPTTPQTEHHNAKLASIFKR